MSETPRRQSEFLDILARLIDPQLQLADAQNLSPEQRVEVQFKQLPWSVEHAIIEFLYGESPDLFVAEPTHLFPDCSYGDASDDLTNRDSYYDGHSYIRHYQFSDEFVRLSGSASGDGGLSTVPAALDLWMKANGLFEPSEDHRDPHFAERAFLVNVFVPAFGMPALNHLKPQKPYCPYSVDFELQTASGPVIIEVDGFEYHDRDINQFEYERKRQNELTAKGLPFYRFPARRILREPDSVVGELKSYITLSVQTELDLFSTSAEDDFADSAHLIQFALDYCRWFRPFQLSLLLALSRAMGKDSFVIAERASPSGLLFVAAYELGCLIARLQEFYGVALPWPKCVRMLTASDPNRKVINEFQKALTNGPDRQDEHPLPFTVSLETRHDTESGPRADLITDINREGRIPIVPEGGAVDVLGHESLNLATLRARLKALVISRPGPRNKLLPKDVRKQTIDYFARRLLRVPALYHHYDPKNSKTEERQYELVRRVLEKKPVLGIMPTGRGKSIAFQLPALLLPGSALVVSPLRALMRDQINDLRLGRGVNAVEAIRYDMSRPEKDRAADDFLNGYVKLLYVSPERLQEINFSKKLAEAAAVAHVSFLAIDEAHCVSEWGHDFRLSYMHIRHFQADLAERQPGVTCPIVALTAMASPTVRLDVCSILALERADVRAGGDLVNEENIDRTELSLSVHKVTGQDYAGDRESILRDVLARCVPRALRNNHEFSWERFARGEWKGRGTGAVFCIYKDAHGQTAWHDGVGAVRDYLVHEEVIGRESLKMFAADSPGFCVLRQ